MPDELKVCIASWERICPDYTIKRWDENNSPMNNSWVKAAYKHHKFAFVADYIRFYALYSEGGIYMDTDMLLIKNIDRFLSDTAFVGFEDEFNVSMGIIGAEKCHFIIKKCLDFYDSTVFDMVRPPIITHIMTSIINELSPIDMNKYQKISGISLYPSDYFYPIHYKDTFTPETMDKYYTENTHGVHLWSHSWVSEFSFFEKKKYKEGFKIASQRLLRTPFLPIGYYKKLIKYILKFTFGK